MELEVCTSLGSMFHRRGALLVKEIRPANDAGWNGRKSPCCRPRVPCWCSWKLSFSESNAYARADCWWQRRMVTGGDYNYSCRDQRWDKRVSFKFLISGKTSSWGWHLPGIERPFSRAPEVDLVDQSAWMGWLLKQHTPNLAESLRQKIAFLPWGSIACTYGLVGVYVSCTDIDFLIMGLVMGPKRRRIESGKKLQLVFSVGELQKCCRQFACHPVPIRAVFVCATSWHVELPHDVFAQAPFNSYTVTMRSTHAHDHSLGRTASR